MVMSRKPIFFQELVIMIIRFWLSLILSKLIVQHDTAPLKSSSFVLQYFFTFLFWEFIFFVFSFSFLYFWATCPNLLQCLHNLPSLSSNSALSSVRAQLWLSMSFISLLYWSRNIALCSEQDLYVCKKKNLYFVEELIVFFSCLTCTFVRA